MRARSKSAGPLRYVGLAVGALCAILAVGGAASLGEVHNKNIQNLDDFRQTEYVEALAKELEKEGAAAIKNQEENHRLAAAAAAAENSQSAYGSSGYEQDKKYAHRKLAPLISSKGYSDAVLFPEDLMELSNSKRNFDEIDRSGFSGFSRKRNFDEIDRSGFSGFSRKRNFDEIDRSGLGGFANKRNFDEIDRSGLGGFARKRNFDEIDRSGFPSFSKRDLDEIDGGGGNFARKRNFDEIDRSGVPGFAKRSVMSSSRSKRATAAERMSR